MSPADRVDIRGITKFHRTAYVLCQAPTVEDGNSWKAVDASGLMAPADQLRPEDA